MLLRTLGRTELRLSELGFGCASIASLATRHAPTEVRAALQQAVAAGIGFFDTADVYGQGDSERLLGRLRADSGQPLVIASKLGLTLSRSQAVVRQLKPLLNPLLRHLPSARGQAQQLRRDSERHDFDLQRLQQRLEGSLKRLGVPQLDLLLLHSPPRALASHDGLHHWLLRMRAQGLVREVGVSAATLADAPRWATWDGLACLQLPLTPEPDPQTGRLALAPGTLALLTDLQRRGLGVIAREVYGQGRWAATPAQRAQALAAVLGAPAVASALIGMGCPAHLSANLQAWEQARSGAVALEVAA
jgi:aryl-alcohol dehydrogenase-like predicted oxidoreductase